MANLDPEYLYTKSSVRYSTNNKIVKYIEKNTENDFEEQRKALKNWYKFAHQIKVGTHKEIHHNKKRGYKYYFYGHKNALYSVDLADIFGDRRNEVSESNDGFKYILVWINCMTKFVHAEPIKSKTSLEISNAMTRIFNIENISCSSYPTNIQSDQEFITKIIRANCKKHCANIYYSEADHKASICERYIRTMKNMIVRRLEMNRSEEWIDVLKDVVDQYNNEMIHKSIGMTPAEAEKFPALAWIHLVENQRKNSKKKPFKFKIKELVRLKTSKDDIFRKSSLRTFTAEVYIIYRRRQVNNANIYYVKDADGVKLRGSVNEQLLTHAEKDDHYDLEVLRRNGDMLYVHYDGFPSSKDEWIHESQLV